MDLEELNKTQIILLTLLVSFVTSIATGIVTVTLLAQAPPAVTQTINRVVERTVERIVPVESKNTNIITTEKEITIVIKEEDLITDSIDRNKRKLVRFIKKSENGSSVDVVDNVASVVLAALSKDTVIGLGIIISSDGLVVTDSSLVEGGQALQAVTSGGEVFDIEIKQIDNSSAMALLALIPSGEKKLPTFIPVSLIYEDSLKLGQTVIALSGEERTSVAIGIVSSLVQKDVTIQNTDDGTKQPQTISILDYIETNINSDSILGSPLLNIFGEVIGVKTEEVKGSGSYVPTRAIASLLALFEETVNDERAGENE